MFFNLTANFRKFSSKLVVFKESGVFELNDKAINRSSIEAHAVAYSVFFIWIIKRKYEGEG